MNGLSASVSLASISAEVMGSNSGGVDLGVGGVDLGVGGVDPGVEIDVEVDEITLKAAKKDQISFHTGLVWAEWAASAGS